MGGAAISRRSSNLQAAGFVLEVGWFRNEIPGGPSGGLGGLVLGGAIPSLVGWFILGLNLEENCLLDFLDF